MSATSSQVQLGRELAAIVGEEHLCDDPSLLTPFAIEGVRPSASVAPGSAEEIAAVLRFAGEHDLSVVPCGGFSKQGLGRKPQRIDVLLRTERLNQALHYDPGDLTIGVSAGMRIADAQAMALQNKLLLPLDVPPVAQATVGGVLATAAAGPLKHGYGGVREYCIGVSFVTGDGRIAKAGGRVVKNVAGYDLMKLLIGSHGTLGVILSANFKLFPAPRQTRTFIASFASLEEATAFRRAVQKSPLAPICLEIASPLANAYLSIQTSEVWSVLVRAAGSDNVLARYQKELWTANCRELGGEDEALLWNTVRDYPETVIGQHHNALILSVQLSTASIDEALAAAEQIATRHNFLFAGVGRMGIASLVFALIPISVDPPSVTQFASAVSAIRASLPPDAAAIVQRCPREAKDYIDVWGPSTNDLEAMKAVKRVLDPKDILNRGRFLF